MSVTDFRVLCAQFVDAVDLLCGTGDSPARPGQRLILTTHVEGLEELAAEARAALGAEPAPAPEGGPSDEEILRIYGLAKRDHCYEADLEEWPKKAERAATVAGLRAVLARYGTPAPVPSDKERDEMAAWLRDKGRGAWPCPDGFSASAQSEEYEFMSRLTRAADLLSSTPAPVPVAERLPGEGDCDKSGYFWCCLADDRQWLWINIGEMNWEYRDHHGYTHWLPHWALPLPVASQSEQA